MPQWGQQQGGPKGGKANGKGSKGKDFGWDQGYGYQNYGKGGAPSGYGGKGPWQHQEYWPYVYPSSFKSNEWDALPPVLVCPIKECQTLHSNPKQKQCRCCHHSPLTLLKAKDVNLEETTIDSSKDNGKGTAKGSPATSAEGATLHGQPGQAAGKTRGFTIDQTQYVLTQPLLKSHLEIKLFLVASGCPANLDQGEDTILPSQAVLDPAKVEALKDLNSDFDKAKARGQTNLAKAIEDEIKNLKQPNAKDAKSPTIDAIYLDQVTLAKTKSARWLNDSAEAAKTSIKQQAAALMKRYKEIEAQQNLANAQYATLLANVTLARQISKAAPQAITPSLTAGDISNQLLRRKEGFVSELSNKENIVNAVSELDSNPILSQLGPDALKVMKAKMHEVFTMGIHGTLAQTVSLIGSGFFEPQAATEDFTVAASIPVDDTGNDLNPMDDEFPQDWDVFAQQ